MKKILMVLSMMFLISPTALADEEEIDCFNIEWEREECLKDCRWRFLGIPARGDWDRGRNMLYARCVHECEDEYWDKFDYCMELE